MTVRQADNPGPGRWWTGATAACVFLLAGWASPAPPAAIAGAGRPEVFIYAANETATDGPTAENTLAVVERLRGVGGERLDRIADGLQREMVQFPEVVAEELEAIGRRLPGLGRSAPATVVFTNRLLREGRYLEHRPGEAGFAERSIEVGRSEDLILAGNPVCDPAVFAALLDEVARRFDPARHDFVLMTKSHGNAELAMTPRVCRLASDLGPEELSALAGVDDRSEAGATPAPRLGTTRRQYFDILGERGRARGMRFALVYTEACAGQFADELKVRLPGNVERMYATAGGAEYRNVDFDQLFDRIAEGVPVSAALEEQLAAQSPGITHAPLWRRGLWLLFWLPLLAWVAWFLARRRRRLGR